MRIGVVGSGASAVCLLTALARQPGMPPGELTVFEAGETFWRGRPYQPDLDAVRVNAPPRDMSVRADDVDHLEQWLTARALVTGSAEGARFDPRAGTRFLPRALYGDYLEQSARTALRDLLAAGWRVELVRGRVDAVRLDGGDLVLCADGRRTPVDRVVLCFGAGSPPDVYDLAGTAGFVADPYPTASRLADVDPDAAVGVLGSGLTAVDVVLALTAHGHRGPVTLLSRRGVLPAVRQQVRHLPLRHFTPARFRAIAAAGGTLTLAEVVDVMAEELAAAGEDLWTVTAELDSVRHEDAQTRLRRQFAEVESASYALRIVQQAVPDAGPDVWPLLPAHEQDTLQHDRALMSLCCPMPPSSAETLLGLFDSGRLEIAQRVVSVRPEPGGFVVGAADGERRFDVVVNAVNARSRRLSAKATTLVGSLVAAGFAEPHPRGGVAVDRATSALTVEGIPDPRFYALGDPAMGSLFFTFGVQSLVDRAVDIAQALVPAHAVRSAALQYI
ncbi:MAG: FAD/NAD(P)-binding protein [Actinophytocola sp.]|uniref:FAD/NAD(P)-binding protein n=1 Tax=Actinophytocola sp. TaxID=1872138 RepID=UPI003D6BE7DF